jgi:glutamate synthase (NADPH/NADH) small chain
LPCIICARFTGDEHGNLKQLHAVRVGPPPTFEPIPGSEFTLDVDLVLLAMGFLGPVRSGMIEQMGLALYNHGNVAIRRGYMSSVEGILAGGDMRRGQSLAVWAIAEGRKAAADVDSYLIANSEALSLRALTCLALWLWSLRPLKALPSGEFSKLKLP